MKHLRIFGVRKWEIVIKTINFVFIWNFAAFIKKILMLEFCFDDSSASSFGRVTRGCSALWLVCLSVHPSHMCPSLLLLNARGKLQLSQLTKPNDEKN